jgi:hypothetical protein
MSEQNQEAQMNPFFYNLIENLDYLVDGEESLTSLNEKDQNANYKLEKIKYQTFDASKFKDKLKEKIISSKQIKQRLGVIVNILNDSNLGLNNQIIQLPNLCL